MRTRAGRPRASRTFDVSGWIACEEGRAPVGDASSGMDRSALEPQLRVTLAGLALEAFHLAHIHIDHAGGAARMSRILGLRPTVHAEGSDVVEDAIAAGAAFSADRATPALMACAVSRCGRLGSKPERSGALDEVKECPPTGSGFTLVGPAADP